MGSYPGSAFPLGVSIQDKKINFALVSSRASQITLHLFNKGRSTPFASHRLSPSQHRTGDVWHICLELDPSQEIEYCYDIEDLSGKNYPGLIDPYAKGLTSSHVWGEKDLNDPKNRPRGKVYTPLPFDWEGTTSPHLPAEKLVIYELYTRGFTSHPSSHTTHPGTFLALVDKIPYLKTLGVNAIELMPIFEFNECENTLVNPLTHERLKNVWGYSTINFFSLMNRYSSSSEWGRIEYEFKTLVKECHLAGIEVYLDVVYNHTAEGGKKGPLLSFKGIDHTTYYLLDQQGEYLNFSGTGNTLNANHFVTAEMILSSLRYFALEMRVDGFRFDLASCLTRDTKGEPSTSPLIINMISQDPCLKQVKLIAEAWDASGLYQLGHFPGGSRFLEWNGFYRDSVRQFIKGSEGACGSFAQALTGSCALYGTGKAPTNSINFVCCHDGFTLHDLVSYNDKHNEANGEKNLDGTNDNRSWNCGIEGETQDPVIQALRQRQMRNFHVALMVSIGVPMLWMGDEYAHTKQGNNNSYCQDNEMNTFLWDKLSQEPLWFRFYQKMIAWRKNTPLVQRNHCLSPEQILWHGREPLKADWGSHNKLVAYTLVHPQEKGSLFIAFNADSMSTQIHLPQMHHKQWYKVVDTAAPAPLDFIDHPRDHPPQGPHYTLSAYSSIILQLE